jgi:hypothetical protein
MTFQYAQCETPEKLEHRAMRRLADAIDFLDKCRSQPNSGETGAYRDAIEWVESAAREAVEAHGDVKVSQILRAKVIRAQDAT